MLLYTGWVFFGIEVALAVSFGVIFWRLWSHSAMEHSLARKIITVYVFGVIACLVLSLALPL
jgi:hypothetical protein